MFAVADSAESAMQGVNTPYIVYIPIWNSQVFQTQL